MGGVKEANNEFASSRNVNIINISINNNNGGVHHTTNKSFAPKKLSGYVAAREEYQTSGAPSRDTSENLRRLSLSQMQQKPTRPRIIQL